MGHIHTSTFTTKQLITAKIDEKCSKTVGSTLIQLIIGLEHVNMLDAMVIVAGLEEEGRVIRQNGHIFKA